MAYQVEGLILSQDAGTAANAVRHANMQADFVSLDNDADALDEALRQLRQRAGGRLPGVISSDAVVTLRVVAAGHAARAGAGHRVRLGQDCWPQAAAFGHQRLHRTDPQHAVSGAAVLFLFCAALAGLALVGPLGGDLQIGARLATGGVDAIVFLRDPMTSPACQPWLFLSTCQGFP